MNKNIKRLVPILSNGVRSVITPLLSIGFSFVIVHYFSKQLWGEFVDILLMMLLATIISNWGSKDFLIRTFSKNPKKITTNWQDLFFARIPILILFIAYILFDYSNSISFWLVLWLISSFIFHSFSSVLIYNRDYAKALFFELISFSVLVSLLFVFKNRMSLPLLIQCYAIHYTIKAILFSLLYLRFFKFTRIKFNTILLLQSGVFFLLGIAGFLQSKVDVYVLQFHSDVVTLGEYQIISGFLIFTQSIPTILILPYVKNIYRMSSKATINIKNLMSIIGLVINAITLLTIYFVLKAFFDIHLSFSQIIVSYFIGYPAYIYAIHIFDLFKKQKELIVLKSCILCATVNLILSVTLLHLNYEITGLLFANAFAQVVCLFYYTQFKIDD